MMNMSAERFRPSEAYSMYFYKGAGVLRIHGTPDDVSTIEQALLQAERITGLKRHGLIHNGTTTGKGRKKTGSNTALAEARYLFFYLARKINRRITLQVMANVFNMSHSSVSCGLRRANDLISIDKKWQQWIKE